MSDMSTMRIHILPRTYSTREKGRARYSESALLARSGETCPGPVKAARNSASMLCQPRKLRKKVVLMEIRRLAPCTPSRLSALRGGEDPHTRRRTMHALIAAQVAFCFLILFVAGLFAATFERLSHRPIGFSADRLLLLHTVAQRAEAPVFWDQVAEHLRTVPGVEAVALAGWPLLDGNAWNGFISVNGAPPG